MYWKIALIILVFWMYRRIGVLYYQINSARSEYEKTNVSFSNEPNLLRFLFKRITRDRFRWLIYYTSIFDYLKFNKRDTLLIAEIYAEIYLWPFYRLRRLYKDLRFRLIKRIYATFRITERKLLKKSIYFELKEEVEKYLRGFGIVGLQISGKDQIILKLPKKTLEFFGPWERDKENAYKWYAESAFKEDAEKFLKCEFRLPNIPNKKLKNTKEVVVKVWNTAFCDRYGGLNWIEYRKWIGKFVYFLGKVSEAN